VAVTSRLISRLAFLSLARLCEQHPVPSLGFGFFFCCCFSRTQHRPDFIFLWLVLLALSSSLPREDFYFAADNPCAGYFGPWARAALFPGHALDFSTDRSVFHCFSVPVFLAILLLRFSLLPIPCCHFSTWELAFLLAVRFVRTGTRRIQLQHVPTALGLGFIRARLICPGRSSCLLASCYCSVRSLDFRQWFDSFCVVLCYGWIIVGRWWYSSWVTRSKDSRIRGLNHSSTVISRTCPSGVRWNACEVIYCSLTQFLSSILHVFLPASIHVSVAIPNSVPRADSLLIARRFWPS
jgi:hypothetical protein